MIAKKYFVENGT